MLAHTTHMLIATAKIISYCVWSGRKGQTHQSHQFRECCNLHGDRGTLVGLQVPTSHQSMVLSISSWNAHSRGKKCQLKHTSLKYLCAASTCPEGPTPCRLGCVATLLVVLTPFFMCKYLKLLKGFMYIGEGTY